MDNKVLYILAVVALCAFSSPAMDRAYGGQCRSRYTTLSYNNDKVLKEFDNTLRISGTLRRSMNKKNTITTQDETIAKIDTIIEKAMTVLDMFPNNMHITVVVVPDKRAIAQIYKKKYGKNVGFVAYYSLGEDTIYVSADHGNLEVVSHEIGHAIVDHFFQVRPPYNIHEMMAQFTSKHIND